MTDLQRESISFENYQIPRYKELPDVGLLLDQTVRLINGYLEPLGSIRLTNSMVSNYVKQKIIARPVRKMYYREQIADLIYIALAKSVLSLEDAARFLTMQRNRYSPAAAYDYFCTEFERCLRNKFSGIHTRTSYETFREEGREEQLLRDAFLVECLSTAAADCIFLGYKLSLEEL